MGAIIQEIGQAWPWFWPSVVGVFGAVMGSFLGCVTYRLPRKLSLRQPPSFCPHCQKTLGILDLVPVFSWLVSLGKCRHCAAPMGVRYVAIELLTILVFLGVYAVVELSFWLLPALALSLCLLGLLFIALKV